MPEGIGRELWVRYVLERVFQRTGYTKKVI